MVLLGSSTVRDSLLPTEAPLKILPPVLQVRKLIAMSTSPAATQLCRRLKRKQIDCIETGPGQFSIDQGEAVLTYFGEGSWLLKCWPLTQRRFSSTSTSSITQEVVDTIQMRNDIQKIFLAQAKQHRNFTKQQDF